jgi:hypothetical protein
MIYEVGGRQCGLHLITLKIELEMDRIWWATSIGF